MRRARVHNRAALGCLLTALLFGGTTEARDRDKKAAVSADDLVVVDCLLPHKTRRLGRRATFLVPRKPIRTTAVDCRIRGGEYTEPDQASLATALAVWQPQAAAGDPEAQFYVGQIYEKGLGAAADPARAAAWYRKAAEQDYHPAQVGLGYLYESGSGVEQDAAEALRWYRRAAGAGEDLVLLAEQDYAALVTAQQALDAAETGAAELRRQVEALEDQLAGLAQASDAERAQRASLDSLLARLRSDLDTRTREVDAGKQRIAALEAVTAAAAALAPPATARRDPASDPSTLPFGRHCALVIGNSHYQALAATPTAAGDARAVAALLGERYGFAVTLLIDATRYDIMSALNQLRRDLTESDHLLVYYAGHGVRDGAGDTAYWQPVDADPRSPANWIPNAVVTEHLDIIPARHVFVVADSVYSGLRTRSSVARLPRGMTAEQRFFHLKGLLEKRSRLVLAAGTEVPIADSARSDHSRFTSTLLDVLGDNQSILEASALYFEVNRRLSQDPASRLRLDFATLKWARSDIGDFFFVPRSS